MNKQGFASFSKKLAFLFTHNNRATLDERLDVHYYVPMNTQTTISISEARKKIFQIAQKVQKPYIHYTLTEKGRPYVVIMSADEFESWQETLEVMQEYPDLKKDAATARRAVATKEYKKYKTLEEMIGEKKVIEKQKRTHGISHTLRAKSGKRPR